MNLRSLSYVILTSLLISNPVIGQRKPVHALHWDFHHSQELTGENSIQKAHDLTPTDRAALITFLEAAMRPLMGNSEDEIQSASELRHVAEETRLRLVDLNGDGKPEIILQAMGLKAGCGATGNCSIWVLERTATGYSQLVQGSTFKVQTFTVQGEQTNGYKDLVLGMHGSASEQTLFLLRYKDGKYYRSGCYDANWEIVSEDSIQQLKAPKITPCGH
ncbi:hypothetical protein [Acidicapsa ligni]|uniref:hypothetical protein n=1 Tax=Acidicapsa ligni TaxID=542300 RepID=UPI0021DF6478|nr:hypothetical protein [Acidicapsa ligni]